MDRLRRSLEQVEAPTCPNCHIDMEWYQSALVAQQPIVIEHMFHCPTCQRVSGVKSTFRHDPTPPPGKLSAPRHRWRSAA